MTNHRITVYGEDCEVTLEKSSKTRWRARGLCHGKYHEQIAPSQKRALDGWKYRAELALEYGSGSPDGRN
jgi:hypothetical protein